MYLCRVRVLQRERLHKQLQSVPPHCPVRRCQGPASLCRHSCAHAGSIVLPCLGPCFAEAISKKETMTQQYNALHRNLSGYIQGLTVMLFIVRT